MMTSETCLPSMPARSSAACDGDLAEFVRRQVGKGAVEGADRRACGTNDDDVVLHEVAPCLLADRHSMARSGLQNRRPCDPAGYAPHKTVAPPLETAYFEPTGPIPGVSGRYASEIMAKSDEPITIKKYANRRLYNTGTSTYVTLEDLATMVKAGENFVVYDAKTAEDITRSVLAQIIFEQENKEGQNLLPINFLRQLIRFYGDTMQMMVPRYLEVSIESFTREQEKMRDQMAQAFGSASAPVLRSAGGPGPAQHGNVREGVFACSRRSPRARAPAAPAGQGSSPTSQPAHPKTSTRSSARSKRCRGASTGSATRADLGRCHESEVRFDTRPDPERAAL